MSAVLDINAADNTFFGAELDKKYYLIILISISINMYQQVIKWMH